MEGSAELAGDTRVPPPPPPRKVCSLAFASLGPTGCPLSALGDRQQEAMDFSHPKASSAVVCFFFFGRLHVRTCNFISCVFLFELFAEK